jgi:hypothetical protein
MPEEYILQAIEDIKKLQPNWDSEGAEVPSEKSIHMALDVLQWAQQKNVKVLSIDADVLGGMAIYLTGTYIVWVCILNNSSYGIIYDNTSLELTFDNLNKLHKDGII